MKKFDEDLTAKESICNEPPVTELSADVSACEAVADGEKAINEPVNSDPDRDSRLISSSVKALFSNVSEDKINSDQKEAVEEFAAIAGGLVSEFNGFGRYRIFFLGGVVSIALIPSALKFISGFLSGSKEQNDEGLEYHDK